jgi:hypothetical protein
VARVKNLRTLNQKQLAPNQHQHHTTGTIVEVGRVAKIAVGSESIIGKKSGEGSEHSAGLE